MNDNSIHKPAFNQEKLNKNTKDKKFIHTNHDNLNYQDPNSNRRISMMKSEEFSADINNENGVQSAKKVVGIHDSHPTQLNLNKNYRDRRNYIHKQNTCNELTSNMPSYFI
jgi:hypothetical protein